MSIMAPVHFHEKRRLFFGLAVLPARTSRRNFADNVRDPCAVCRRCGATRSLSLGCTAVGVSTLLVFGV
jgi:hypothetical protein